MASLAGPHESVPIDTVIFDLGDVLLSWDPEALFRKQQPTAEAVQLFVAETDFYQWNYQHDLGNAWQVGADEIARTHPEHAAAFAEIAERFAETFAGNVPGSIEILGELRATGVQLLALTNFAKSNFIKATATYPWLAWFDGIVISSHEGIAKPDTRIYRILMRRYDVDPTHAVFVDDRGENVRAARALGFVGIDFHNAAQLRGELVRLQLLTEHESEETKQ